MTAVLALEPENPHGKLEQRRLQQRIAHAQVRHSTAKREEFAQVNPYEQRQFLSRLGCVLGS